MNSKDLHIRNYKRFLVSTSTSANAIDTKTQYGMVAKSNPYPLLPNPKSVYSNDWKDQNGADEYVTSVHFEPIEFSVDFYVCTEPTMSGDTITKTASKALREQMDSFFAMVDNGYFLTYDEYTTIGFQNVRYMGYEQSKFYATDEKAYAVFKVKFKANDPTTRMTLSNGKIVVEQ